MHNRSPSYVVLLLQAMELELKRLFDTVSSIHEEMFELRDRYLSLIAHRHTSYIDEICFLTKYNFFQGRTNAGAQ